MCHAVTDQPPRAECVQRGDQCHALAAPAKWQIIWNHLETPRTQGHTRPRPQKVTGNTCSSPTGKGFLCL